MQIVMWGVGRYLKKNLNHISCLSEIIFIDKSCSTEGELFQGRPVYPPDWIRKANYDLIVISSNEYFAEIATEMIYQYGVDLRKIVSFDCFLAVEEKDTWNISLLQQRNSVLMNEKVKGLQGSHLARLYIIPENDSEYCLYDHREQNSQNTDLLNIGGCLFKTKKMEHDISVYVITHKKFPEIQLDGYQTIFAGAANVKEHPYPGDDIGDNISDKNALINECTALYWIWKHCKSEYVGTAHYRRFLESPVNEGWPLQKSEIYSILQRRDFIVAKVYHSNVTIRAHLESAVGKEAFERSFRAIRKIFDQRTWQEQSCLDALLNGKAYFICNIFITRKQYFDEYCEWLFPILFSMIDEVEIDEEWDAYTKRVIGFWAEALFTVWLCITDYTIMELPLHITDNGKPYGR